MTSLLRDRITLVWLGLVVATLVAGALGSAALVVAFVKVRFVGTYFMELRHAPTPLKLVFDGWVIVVCGVLVGISL